nr:allergin-1 isoform X2 [Zootoca vivipara]
MLKCLVFVCLPLVCAHSCLPKLDHGGGKKVDQKDVPDNFATRSGSKAVFSICSHPNETIIGGNVILVCYYSKNDWLPINYTLFRNQITAIGYATTYRTEERAMFNLTVMSTSDLGEYKCKAQRFKESQYSRGLNITLKDVSDNFATHSGSKAVFSIYSHPNETIIGGNVILVCYYSKNDWLPINYTLFRNQAKAVGYATTYGTEEKAVFNLTVMSTSDLGEYKCKAQRFTESQYSRGLNITLRVAEEKKNKNLVAYIVAPLLLLLLLLAVSTAIALLILPWCKARFEIYVGGLSLGPITLGDTSVRMQERAFSACC